MLADLLGHLTADNFQLVNLHCFRLPPCNHYQQRGFPILFKRALDFHLMKAQSRLR